MKNLIRPDLLNFKSYSSARDEAKHGAIWLNANESPYPNNLDNQVQINRYPEKQPKLLVQRLAELYEVNENQLVISRGSDEVIDLLTRLFCVSGKDSIMICPPTFGMYSVCAKLQGANVIEVPLLKSAGFQLDMKSLISQHNSTVKILFLCSPNNPTGNSIKKDDIFSLCDRFRGQSIIVVDEAYVEFSEDESLSKAIQQFPNLVILRTLSKAYGLAGARCGVLLAQSELVEWVLKMIPPYPIPSYANKLILEKLSNIQEVQHQIDTTKIERERVFNVLKNLPYVKNVWKSKANFLLVNVNNAEKVMQCCAEQGIILRNLHGKTGLEQCVRISIGLPNENDKLIDVLLSVIPADAGI